jgi:hypothetical protein
MPEEKLLEGQEDDVPLGAQGAPALFQAQEGLGGTGDEIQLLLDRGAALPELVFVDESQIESFELRVVPEQLRFLLHLHASDHAALTQKQGAGLDQRVREHGSRS